MSQPAGSNVYHGVWINHSHNPIVGSTITLSSRNGSLLTAFLAIFVAATGAAVWKILSFSIHQLRTSQDPRDGLHHQQQAILRNSGTPGAASWQLLQLSYAWRKLAKRPFWRSLPLALLALANLIAFALAGIFSSEVTKAAGDAVLIRSDNCGNWTLNSTNAIYAFSHKTLNDTITAAGYARACYDSQSDTLQCNQYSKQRITYTTNRNDTCPFAAGMCLSLRTPAMSMDTGNISSHDDLGINAQERDRITYRRKTTCAPIKDKGYITSLNYTDANKLKDLGAFQGQDGDVLDFYNFGRENRNNFTYFYNRHAATTGFGYEIGASLYSSGGLNNTWIPDKALSRDDADVSIIFLAANSILYTKAVYDPIFLATTAEVSVIDNGRNTSWFSSDYFVSPLACIDQHQFCNPNNQKCTDLQSYYTAVKTTATIGLNAVQSMIISRLSIDFIFQTITHSIGGRGPAALRAQESVSGLLSDPLPKNQWMIEVESWFATGLARLQQSVVQYATGPPNVVEGAYVSKPTEPISQMMCDNQQVRSTNNAMNFSTLGIVIILIVGGLLIATSLILDTLVGFIQRKRNMRDYQRVQWALDEKLQLQRLAYEEAGMGTWSGGTSVVPVTKFGETFGMPPDVDPDHPRIGRKESGSNVGPSSVYKNESGEELQLLSSDDRISLRTGEERPPTD